MSWTTRPCSAASGIRRWTAYRRALDVDPTDPTPWNNLAACFGEMADAESDPQRAEDLRSQEIAGYENAAPRSAFSRAWRGLAFCRVRQAQAGAAGRTADRDPLPGAGRRGCRKATETDPEDGQSWYLLSAALLTQANETGSLPRPRSRRSGPPGRGACRGQLQPRLRPGPDRPGRRALKELAGCLERRRPKPPTRARTP